MAEIYRIPWADRPAYVDLAIDAIGRDFGRSRLFDEVNSDCQDEKAFLFGNPEGFFVLRPKVLDGRKIMEVLAAYSLGPVDAIRRYGDVIRHLAAEVGAVEMEFSTVRNGFERVAPREGWAKAFTVWRKPV